MRRALFDAGLRRLNVHLDTLDRGRFRTITRRDDLPRVLAGIEAALKLGFQIKLNAVAVKGLNEPDIPALVRFGRENGIEVRFIEFMPLDAQELWAMDRVLTADEMIGTIERQFGSLVPVPDADPRAPATEYRFADGSRVGFIASVSKPFCGNCNRLRLTSDGKMRNCLFARDEVDIKPLLASDDSSRPLANGDPRDGLVQVGGPRHSTFLVHRARSANVLDRGLGGVSDGFPAQTHRSYGCSRFSYCGPAVQLAGWPEYSKTHAPGRSDLREVGRPWRSRKGTPRFGVSSCLRACRNECAGSRSDCRLGSGIR